MICVDIFDDDDNHNDDDDGDDDYGCDDDDEKATTCCWWQLLLKTSPTLQALASPSCNSSTKMRVKSEWGGPRKRSEDNEDSDNKKTQQWAIITWQKAQRQAS